MNLWIKAGDSNTSFFHRQAQSQRKKNTIIIITSSTGQQIDNYDQIKAELAFQYYNIIYQQPREEPMQEEVNILLSNILSLVSDVENNQLT